MNGIMRGRSSVVHCSRLSRHLAHLRFDSEQPAAEDNRQHVQCHTSCAGFTLVEVLIVLSVLAVIAAIAVPALRSGQTQSIESVARTLAADLRLARSLAIRDNSPWTIRFFADANAYELIYTGTRDPAPPMPPAPTGTGWRVELDRIRGIAGSTAVRLAGASLQGTGSAVTEITFAPAGGTGPQRNQDTVIWLTSGTGQEARYVRLTVSWITGQVWIDTPQTFGNN